MHKELLWRGQNESLQRFVELETRALHHSMRGPDAAEGGMAYFERRDPRWQSAVTRDWPEFLNR
jgi:enoyl-CoA hydratase/carnithine racemase